MSNVFLTNLLVDSPDSEVTAKPNLDKTVLIQNLSRGPVKWLSGNKFFKKIALTVKCCSYLMPVMNKLWTTACKPMK